MISHNKSTSINMSCCPLCGGEQSILFSAVDENRRISEISFTYLKCSACNGIRLDSIPKDLSRYYQSIYYTIPSFERLQWLADKDRNKINTILRFATSGRLLEIGPAFGVFAWQAKQAGFEVNVIEMDKNCCDYLQHIL
jgi:hypothetical protein